mgnify:CR=1 FL=1
MSCMRPGHRVVSRPCRIARAVRSSARSRGRTASKRRGGDAGVGPLMIAVEREPHARRKLRLARIENVAPEASHRARRTAATSRCTTPETSGRPCTDDARLLVRDRFERRAERADVIEIDRDDRGDERLGRVRRVETSAQAHLEHRGVHARVAERAQRGGGHHLEERRMRRERSVGQARSQAARTISSVR